MQPLAYLLARLSEPSSYAGLGAILALLGWHLSDSALGLLVQLLAAGCGLLALFLQERGLIRALVLVFAVAPVLSGCGGMPAAVLGGVGAAGSVYAAVDRVTAAAAPYIETGCADYAKIRTAADATIAAGVVPAAIAAKVTTIEGYGDAVCRPGAAPPAGDPASTAIWLGQLAGQLMALATDQQ